jgi:Spy/CpxP family protein refolding chaperone
MRTTRILIILTVLMAVTALPALAQYGGRGQGRGMGRGQDMQDRGRRMCQVLDLTTEQQVLFDAMREAKQAHATAMRDTRQKVRDAFKAELAKETPDFDATAKRVRNELGQAAEGTRDKMIDATATFYKSLTPEQRQQLAALPDRSRGERGMRGGKRMGSSRSGRGSRAGRGF